MPMTNKINGVWRDPVESSSKINSVYRINKNDYVRVNGVWRSMQQPITLEPTNVVGFKMIYTLNANRIHHDVPHLTYNSKVPHIFKLTGDTAGTLDYVEKGVIFEYSRDLPEEQGVIVYEGRLYAILTNGELINVCNMIGNNNDKTAEDEMVSEFSNIYEFSRVYDADIKLTGYVLFEDYGYCFEGWNNIFNTKPFIDQTIYPDKTFYRKQLELDAYNIYPVSERDQYFDSVATIGVARDIDTPNYNMNGSHGVLSHTIAKITLNGTEMPFVIEIK